MRGADLVVQTLVDAGVTTIFAVSGNQVMPVFDACFDTDIRLIHVRHEASAVYMADAWAQITGQIGVALVPAATGFINALGPLYPAHYAESPVLLLSGDSPIAQDGRGAFQELNQVSVSAPLTKSASRPGKVDDLASGIADAIKIARSGRPGPVHVALAHDLLDETTDTPYQLPNNAFEPEKKSLQDAQLKQIIELLAQSHHPLIVTGPTLSPSREPALHQQIAEAFDIPVVAMESPRGLADPSLGAFADIIPQADTVVFLGKEVNFTSGFAKPPVFAESCNFIVIDPEQNAIDQAQRVLGDSLKLSVQADPKSALRDIMTATVANSRRDDWHQQVMEAIAFRGIADSVSGISPSKLCTAVQKILDKANDTILVVDGGEFGQWGMACLSADKRIINGIAGAIGGGLCYAIAAKIAHPESTVVAVMGDGTSGFHFSEFDTAVRYQADIITVIGNDSKWNAEVLIQTRDYGTERLHDCELNPHARYDQAAIGFGCHGEKVSEFEQLDSALQRSLASNRPACINVVLNGQPAPTYSRNKPAGK